MKTKAIALAALCTLVLVAGCDKEPSANQQLEKVKTDTKAAAQDMKDYAFSEREEFAGKMKSQLADINRDLDQLVAKTEKGSEAAKAEIRPKIQAIRTKLDGLSKQLEDVKSANESTWESVKTSARKGFDEAKDGFNQARQWVSEKIAP